MCKGVQGCSRRFGGADVPALSLVASHPGPRSAPTLALGGANPSISLEIFLLIWRTRLAAKPVKGQVNRAEFKTFGKTVPWFHIFR